jgi:hypothetical protein
VIRDPLDISDAWKNSYSENTSRKVFAAKYVARHPNLVALELSSFKCGHDAPIYTVVEEIVENSHTPYFCFKDIDENKPTGSIVPLGELLNPEFSEAWRRVRGAKSWENRRTSLKLQLLRKSLAIMFAARRPRRDGRWARRRRRTSSRGWSHKRGERDLRGALFGT